MNAYSKIPSVERQITSPVSTRYNPHLLLFRIKNAPVDDRNGDRIEIKAGKLTLNGIPYGTVGRHSVVKYTVKGNVKQLLVDGVIRKPD